MRCPGCDSDNDDFALVCLGCGEGLGGVQASVPSPGGGSPTGSSFGFGGPGPASAGLSSQFGASSGGPFSSLPGSSSPAASAASSVPSTVGFAVPATAGAQPFAARAPEAAPSRLALGWQVGWVTDLERDIKLPPSIRWARSLATLLVTLLWAPLLACLVAGLLMIAGSTVVMLLGWIRRTPDQDAEGNARGDQFRLQREDGTFVTVKIRGAIQGPLSDGRNVKIRTRKVGLDQYLVEGENLDEGGAPFRAPRDPWPFVLLAMVGWIVVMAIGWPG